MGPLVGENHQPLGAPVKYYHYIERSLDGRVTSEILTEKQLWEGRKKRASQNNKRNPNQPVWLHRQATLMWEVS